MVLGDTHSQLHPAAPDLIRRQRPDQILHTGDVGTLSILDELESIAPTAAVRGNVDSRGSGLVDIITLEIHSEKLPYFKALMVHVGLSGVRLLHEVRRLAKDRQARLVICGHSHIPFAGVEGNFNIFNPGSLGPRRFGLPITFGCIDITEEKIAGMHLDCETGRQWLPGPSSSIP